MFPALQRGAWQLEMKDSMVGDKNMKKWKGSQGHRETESGNGLFKSRLFSLPMKHK